MIIIRSSEALTAKWIQNGRYRFTNTRTKEHIVPGPVWQMHNSIIHCFFIISLLHTHVNTDTRCKPACRVYAGCSTLQGPYGAIVLHAGLSLDAHTLTHFWSEHIGSVMTKHSSAPAFSLLCKCLCWIRRGIYFSIQVSAGKVHHSVTLSPILDIRISIKEKTRKKSCFGLKM